MIVARGRVRLRGRGRVVRFDREKHHRRSIRLPGYNYTQPGAYFVTVCAHGRECLFGEIVDAKMALNQYGRVVARCWEQLNREYARVKLDRWVVMPNHLHGIIAIDVIGRGGSRTAPTTDMDEPKPLGRLVGSFKTVSTKQINILRGTPSTLLWQRNYYERIIRDDDELDRIRCYIEDNPAMWEMDRENPEAQTATDRESWQL